MNKVTLDETLKAKLNGLNEELAICDAQGRPVSYLVPAARYEAIIADRKKFYDWLMEKYPISDEELDRLQREETGKGRPLSEIWKDLGVK